MKKIIFALVAGCTPVMAVMNGAYAQKSSNSISPKNDVSFSKVAVPGNVYTINSGTVSARAIKHFSQEHKNVTGVIWIPTDAGFRASFLLNGVSNKVYYNKKGSWTGNLKNYTEDKLPFEVRDMVKRAYYDCSINYVDEILTIQSKGIPTYIVHLEDKNSYKFIRVCNGEMDVWKDMKKQQPQ